MQPATVFVLTLLTFASNAGEIAFCKFIEIAFEVKGQRITGFLDYPNELVYMSGDTASMCLNSEAFFTQYFYSKTTNWDSLRITAEIIPYTFQKEGQMIYMVSHEPGRKKFAVKEMDGLKLIKIIKTMERCGVNTNLDYNDTLWTVLPSTIIDSFGFEASEFYFLQHGKNKYNGQLIEAKKKAYGKIQADPAMKNIKEIEAEIERDVRELKKYKIVMVEFNNG